MKITDPIVFRELPVIQKIIQDETWLEGERRGCFVRSDDRVVRDKVCEIILRIGQQLRTSMEEAMKRSESSANATPDSTSASVTQLSSVNAHEAA
jgi:hypothetical protein